MSDPRGEYLSGVVNGKSFADVRGPWYGERKVSVAHRYVVGALTRIDVAAGT